MCTVICEKDVVVNTNIASEFDVKEPMEITHVIKLVDRMTFVLCLHECKYIQEDSVK
jgi:hypothetical protein